MSSADFLIIWLKIRLHFIDFYSHKALIVLRYSLKYFLGNQPDESFWTSGRDFHNITNYYWDSTATYLTDTGFEYWARGEPSLTEGEHCIEYTGAESHLWKNTNCDIKKLFVCEFQPCKVPTVCSKVNL
jgi:hypothetical protein